MIDAVLIYPPIGNPFFPYLSVPTLASFLADNGRTVEQRDLNLELFDLMFTTEFIKSLEKDLVEKINFFDELNELDWKQQEELVQLICLKIALDNLNSSFDLTPEQAKEAFRDINSYRYEDNLPVMLEPWTYYQRLSGILTYLISPVQLPVCDTQSVIRAIKGEEYFLYFKPMKDIFVNDILKNKPKFVGISITYQSQVVAGLYLAYLLKQADPSIFLCIGGQHFSTISHDIPQLYKDIDFVDAIVVDEGELAITGILDYIDGKEAIENIPNLFYMKDGNVIENTRGVIKNINSYPLPDFSGLPLEKYFTGSVVLPYAASKGCYYNKCSFCSFPFISPKYRVKEPKEVAMDLKILSEKYNTKLFYLTNEADPPKRINQLSEEIIKLDIDIYYHSFCRFDRKVDRNTIELLAKSGCKVLFFGLESATNRINEMMMNKGISLEKAKEILKICDEHDISTVVSSIIAFPTETLYEAISTKEFLQASSYYRNHVPQSHDFRLPRGTDTEINHEKYGITKLYRNEGNLSTILNNYETSFEIIPYEKRQYARIRHETVDSWPHHDCLELQYALYYNGNVPVVFGYNKKLEPPKNPKKKVSKPFNPANSYDNNKHPFDEMIKRKGYRIDLANILYKKGYFYEEIEKTISETILGKNVKQYEYSIFAEFSKIQNLLDEFRK